MLSMIDHGPESILYRSLLSLRLASDSACSKTLRQMNWWRMTKMRKPMRQKLSRRPRRIMSLSACKSKGTSSCERQTRSPSTTNQGSWHIQSHPTSRWMPGRNLRSAARVLSQMLAPSRTFKSLSRPFRSKSKFLSDKQVCLLSRSARKRASRPLSSPLQTRTWAVRRSESTKKGSKKCRRQLSPREVLIELFSMVARCVSKAVTARVERA